VRRSWPSFRCCRWSRSGIWSRAERRTSAGVAWPQAGGDHRAAGAERAGWRGALWRYRRDFDPAFDSIRNEPEFKAIFADIERDMARQRAELAKRPKDAPLDMDPSRETLRTNRSASGPVARSSEA